METFWRFLNEKTELSDNSAILLLGIYPKEMKSRVFKSYPHLNVHCSIAHKQDMETPTNKRIKKMWCVTTMQCYSAVNQKEILPLAITLSGP